MLNTVYNEFDPFAAAWCRALVRGGMVPQGKVDSRSIVRLRGTDCGDSTHFFAGILGWPLALEYAGWPEDVPVWTGSCPCQPFSDAGKRKGKADKRHLWPEMLRLIKERIDQGKPPPAIFGEQTESQLAREWLSGVRSDLEAVGYRFGAADLCSAGVGSPHIRQRFFWGAIKGGQELASRLWHPKSWEPRGALAREVRRANASIELHEGFPLDASRRLPHAKDAYRGNGDASEQEQEGLRRNRSSEHARHDCGTHNESTGKLPAGAAPKRRKIEKSNKRGAVAVRVGDAVQSRLEGLRRHVDDREEPRWFFTYPDGSAAATSLWNDFNLVACRDGKIRRVGTRVARGVVDGISGRVGKLRGFGNAINPALAAVFVRSFTEAWLDDLDDAHDD